MDILYAAILGVVQGLTEFLPISSSGHLIVLREILGLDLSGSMAFDAVLQLATSCAVLIYFWKDLAGLFHMREAKDKIVLLALVLGTIPAVIIGLLFEDYIDVVFRHGHVVAWGLIAGSILFFLAEKFSKPTKEITAKNGFIVGCFQLLAFVPGMSRSGSTISGGLLLGIKREDAVRFSFLLSLPILLGSGLKKLFDLQVVGGIHAPLVVGSLVACVVGLLSIHFLIVYLRKHTLNAFIVYRILLAVVIFMFL